MEPEKCPGNHTVENIGDYGDHSLSGVAWT